MFCKYCGKEIENGKEVCDECASRQTNVVNEQPVKESVVTESTSPIKDSTIQIVGKQ